MEKTLIWCLLGVISLGSAAWSQDKRTGGGTEKAVAALEQQWLQAQKTNNPDLVAPLLADKFVNTSSDGKVTGKAETLGTIKTIRWNSAEYSEVKVTVFGDTAIATGDFKGTGTDASGKLFDDHERWSMAVCCESRDASKNVSDRPRLNRNGHPRLWRPPLLSPR